MKTFTYFLLMLIVIGCTDNSDQQLVRPNKILDLTEENAQAELDKIVSLNESELDAWERAHDFISYRTVLKNAYKELDSVDTEAELEKFQAKYNHVLTLVDSFWTPAIDVTLYQRITDEHGFYRNGNFLNRILGDYIVTSNIENYTLLKNLKLESLNERNNVSMRLKIVKFKSPTLPLARTTSTCTAFENASYFHNESNCRNDREVIITAKSYMLLTRTSEGDWRQFRVELKVVGKQRLGTWCTWRGYITPLSYRNVSYTIDGWTIVNGVPVRTPYTIVPVNATLESTQLIDDRWLGAKVLNANLEPNPFTSVHMEGTSRGVAGVWAVIDCQ